MCVKMVHDSGDMALVDNQEVSKKGPLARFSRLMPAVGDKSITTHAAKISVCDRTPFKPLPTRLATDE